MKALKSFLAASVLISSPLLISCGGGDDSPEVGGSTSDNINISPATVEDVEKYTSSLNAVKKSLSDIENVFGQFENSIHFINEASVNNPKIIPYIYSIVKKSVSRHEQKGIYPQGQDSYSYTESCDEGSVYIDASWTDPNCTEIEAEECFKNNEFDVTLDFSNCKYSEVAYNGKVKAYVKIEDEELKNIEVSIDRLDIDYNSHHYSYKYSFSNFTLEANLPSQNLYNLRLDGEMYVEDKTNMDNIKISFFNMGLNLDILSRDYYGNPIEKKATINGDMEFYKNNIKKFDIKTIDLAIYTDHSNSYETYRINGYIYEGVCTDKWFKIETIQDIKMPSTHGCPTEGKIKINNSITLEATSSGGIIIKDNIEEKFYESCEDLENTTNTCSI